MFEYKSLTILSRKQQQLTELIKDNGHVLIFTRHVIKYREKSALR